MADKEFSVSNMAGMKKNRMISSMVLFVVVLVLAVLFVMPFFLMVLNSFKLSTEFIANPLDRKSVV